MDYSCLVLDTPHNNETTCDFVHKGADVKRGRNVFPAETDFKWKVFGAAESVFRGFLLWKWIQGSGMPLSSLSYSSFSPSLQNFERKIYIRISFAFPSLLSSLSSLASVSYCHYLS
jgi:hypothetical protein